MVCKYYLYFYYNYNININIIKMSLFSDYSRHITTMIVLLGVGFLYNRYKEKFEPYDQSNEYNMIKKFLLNTSSNSNTSLSLGNDKPFLWIHMDYKINSRKWLDFSSRNTTLFNQPYQYLTISSIINHCGKSFNIVLIDDSTFNHIIPNWNHKLSNIPDPIKSLIRKLGLCKLLYLYGGLVLPSSFICIKDMYDFYKDNLSHNDLFVGNFVNKNITSQSGVTNFMPDIKLMGSKRNSESLNDLMTYILKLISTDYTSEEEFDGKISRKCFEMIENNKVKGVCPGKLGVKDENNKPILLDTLMGEGFLKLRDCAFGLYVPSDEILKRTKYEWFARLSIEQILNSNIVLSKYLIINSFNTDEINIEK